MRNPKKGDTVSWSAPGGTAHGTVEKKLTSPTKIKDHKVAASPKEPEYLVRSDKGGRAAHKAGALSRE